MGGVFERDRDAVVALLDRALRDEERTERPLQSDRRNWLYGSAGLTEPDKHGWMAPVPPADVWVPRALVFWRMAVLTGTAVSDEQMYDPSLFARALAGDQGGCGHVLAAERA